MWIIGHDVDYYPYIETYPTYEDAKLAFDKKKDNLESEEKMYLAEVKEFSERE